jgi:hypothetical protein
MANPLSKQTVERLRDRITELEIKMVDQMEDLNCQDSKIERLEFSLENMPSTYHAAKKAVELWEAEYVGQDQQNLWEWAILQGNEDG